MVGTMKPNWQTPPKPERIAQPLQPKVLPDALRRVVQSVSDSYEIPPDFTLLCALACIATSQLGKIKVRVNSEWTETLALYVMPLLETGNMKTPVLNWLKAPLRELETELRREAKTTTTQQRSQQRIADELLKRTEDKLAKAQAEGKVSDALRAELEAAQLQVSEQHVQAMPQILFDDITPEAFQEAAAQQPLISIMASEGGFVQILSGDRYSKGVPNLDAVLKAYSGETIRTNRKGAQLLDAENPCAVICLAAQPGIWQSALEVKAMRDYGFLQRFLVAIPTSYRGRRKLEQLAIPADIPQFWREQLRAIAAQESRELQLTSQAMQILQQLRHGVEGLFGRGEELMDGWLSKLPGNTVRVAALLELFADPAARVIGVESMTSAYQLAQWLVTQYESALQPRTNRRSEDVLKCLRRLAELAGEPVTLINTRQIQQNMKGRNWVKREGTQAIKDELDTLELEHWLRLEHSPGKTEVWQLRPDFIQLYDSYYR